MTYLNIIKDYFVIVIISTTLFLYSILELLNFLDYISDIEQQLIQFNQKKGEILFLQTGIV